jgi:hypothetical protein
VLLFLVFGATSVGLRLYAVRRQREREAESAGEQANTDPAPESAGDADASRATPADASRATPGTGAQSPDDVPVVSPTIVEPPDPPAAAAP